MPPKKSRVLHLYEIVGVDPKASPQEIQKSYRLRARQLHPDKNPGEEKAKEAFQKLQHAYELLKDPERRRAYDETGDESELGGNVTEVVRYMRQCFKPVTVEEIESFTEYYRGSKEERADIVDFLKTHKGDVSNLVGYIMCSGPESVDRLLELIHQLIASGDVPKGLKAAVDRTTPKLRKNAKRMGREAEEVKENGGLAGLAEALRARQQERQSNSVVGRLEAMFGGALPPPPDLGKRIAPANPAGKKGKGAAKKKART